LNNAVRTQSSKGVSATKTTSSYSPTSGIPSTGTFTDGSNYGNLTYGGSSGGFNINIPTGAITGHYYNAADIKL